MILLFPSPALVIFFFSLVALMLYFIDRMFGP